MLSASLMFVALLELKIKFDLPNNVYYFKRKSSEKFVQVLSSGLAQTLVVGSLPTIRERMLVKVATI